MNMIFFGFVLVLTVFRSFSAAHLARPYSVFPRQGLINASFVTSTASTTSIKTSATSGSISTITVSPNATCASTFAPNFPIEWNTNTQGCEFRQLDEDSNFEAYADPCLRSWCDAELASSNQAYWDRAKTLPPIMVTTTRTFFEGLYGTGTDSTRLTGYSYRTTTVTHKAIVGQAVTLKAPCCGRCMLTAETVKLFFWPSSHAITPTFTGLPRSATASVTPLPMDGVGTYIDDTGFTFVSPSIYIGFTSLWATGPCGHIGTDIIDSTIGFDPSEISSISFSTDTETCMITKSSSDGVSTGLQTFYPTYFPSQPLRYSDVAQNCSTIEGYKYFPDHPFNDGQWDDPCHPILAIPDRVRNLQPEWHACSPGGNGGFYDPPVTLSMGSVLVPTATPGQGQPSVVLPTEGGGGLDPSPAITKGTQDPKPTLPVPQSQPAETPLESTKTPYKPGPDPSVSASLLPDPPLPPKTGSSTTIVITPAPVPTATVPAPVIVTLVPVPNKPAVSDARPSEPAEVITFIPTIIATNRGPFPGSPGLSTGLVVGTQTLLPGQAITVGGTTITETGGVTRVSGGTQLFLDPQGTAVIIDHTFTIDVASAQNTLATVVIGDVTITATPKTDGGLVVGSHTLQPGQVVTVDEVPLSLDMEGSRMIVNGQTTINLEHAAQPTPGPGPAVITVNGMTMTANSLSQFVIDGATLSLNGPDIVVSGTTYKYVTDRDGKTIIVAGVGSATSHSSGAIPTDANRDGATVGNETQDRQSGGSQTGPISSENTNRGTRISQFGMPWFVFALCWLVVLSVRAL